MKVSTMFGVGLLALATTIQPAKAFPGLLQTFSEIRITPCGADFHALLSFCSPKRRAMRSF
jgi:hypothetical protein